MVEFYLQNQIPKYRNKTLFKDVLENNPNLIDKTMPFDDLNQFSEYADYLCDCLVDHYYFSEIAFYYAYEFEHYFKVRMKKELPKFAPLLKSEVEANISILKAEVKTDTETENNSFIHGKKVDETNTENNVETDTYGKTTNTETNNNITEENTENSTDNRNTTQYERQLVNDAGTKENNSNRKNTQTGTYDVTHGGTDKKEFDNSSTKNTTNSGTDNETKDKNYNSSVTRNNIELVSGSANIVNIVDEFINKFYSLFMEVLNV